MLRIPAVVAVLGLSALTLSACAAAPSAGAPASCERNESTSSVFGLITSGGDAGAPTVALDAPVYVDETVYTDETVGDGQQVTTDAQDVVFSVAIANGATGETILTSGTQVQPVSSWQKDYDGLAQMMMCATEGSRIVGAVPASDLSEAAAKNLGITDGQSIVVTMDLQKVYLAAADGNPQYNDRRGMPSVVLAPDGTPGVIVPDVAPPSELAVELLKKGDGAEVTDADTVRVQYTGVGWVDRKVISSSWENGASIAVAPGATEPFAAQLVGATVGSQLLIVIPSTTGDGADAPGASIYVVDILGIDEAAAATQ